MKDGLYDFEKAQAELNALIKRVLAGKEEGDLGTLIVKRNLARRKLNQMRRAREKAKRKSALESVPSGISCSGAWGVYDY